MRQLSPQERIEVEAEIAVGLVGYIRSEFGQDDDDAVLDAIEGETNLKEAIREAALLVQQFEADAESLKKTIQTFSDRKARKLQQAERARTAIRDALETLSIKSMPLDIATISVRATQPKLGMCDEAKIPSKYFNLPVPEPVLDKKALLADAKAVGDGEAMIAGVELIPAGTTIAIKFS